MSDIPEDIMQAAQKAFDDAMVLTHQSDADMVIAQAILAERQRCSDICAAEREWGGDIEDAQERIAKGDKPRQIQGWNCEYEEE